MTAGIRFHDETVPPGPVGERGTDVIWDSALASPRPDEVWFSTPLA